MMSSVFQLNSIGTARMKGKILVTTQFDDMNEQYNCSLLVLQNFTTARKSSTMEAIYCDRYLYEGGGGSGGYIMEQWSQVMPGL